MVLVWSVNMPSRKGVRLRKAANMNGDRQVGALAAWDWPAHLYTGSLLDEAVPLRLSSNTSRPSEMLQSTLFCVPTLSNLRCTHGAAA